MTPETRNLFDSLDDLLEKERAALLLGDLEKITVLLSEKEVLFDRLTLIDDATADDLTQLQGKAMRNQALLDNAQMGIRAVATRMANLRRLRRSLETYDETGRKTTITTRMDNQVEKRA